MRYRDINLLDLRNQRLCFSRGEIAAKITGEALFKIFCFANIDNRTAGVIHTVDTRFAGHCFEKGF